MKFANPAWFWLLLPALAWTAYRLKAGFQPPALPYPDLGLLRSRVRSGLPEEKVRILIKCAAWVLLIAALARPQKASKLAEPPKPVVDILLCLDTSGSMACLDFDPLNRLDEAKKTAEAFIRKRPFDRIGLVVFGGKAITQCPLTLDHATLIDFLRTVPLNATETDGTAIGSALALCSTQLAKSEAKSKIIILLTDGRNNTGNADPATVAGAAGDLGIKIYCIGEAVPGGGLIPVQDPMFGKRLVQTGEDLDEGALLEIARLTNGRYFRVTSAERFQQIYDEIDRMEKTKVEAPTNWQYRDIGLPFLLAGFLLLAGEFILRHTLWRTVP